MVILLSYKEWNGKTVVNLKGNPCSMIQVIETYRTKWSSDDCKAGDCQLRKNMHHLQLFLLDAVHQPPPRTNITWGPNMTTKK